MAANFFLDVWNSQIVLRWDGYTPNGIKEDDLADAMRPEYRRMVGTRQVQKKGGLVDVPVYRALPTHQPLRDRLKDPNALLNFLPHIKGHAKYNEKQKCFFLALSRNNLDRLKAQFGHLTVGSGQRVIQDLLERGRDFDEDMRKARVIRERPDLPAYDYKMPPLAPEQHRGTVYLTNVKAAAMFADCGCGKSFMALCSIEQQIKKGIVKPGKTLIVVKLATIKQSWLKDAEKFTNLKLVSLWLPQVTRRKEKMIALLEEPADAYIINHDGVRTIEEALGAKAFTRVIVDESTILKGFRGSRGRGGAFGKSLMRISSHATHRTIMSGTPASNDSDDLWGQFKFIDQHGFLLETSLRDFQAAYMKEVFFGDPNNENTLSNHVMTVAGREQVANLVRPIAFRVRLRDLVKNLPPKTISARSLPMSKEQLKAYNEMEDSLRTVVDDEAISATIQLASIQKLRQITGGFIIDAQEKAHPFTDNPKLEMLDQFLNEEIARDEKVVIFAQYQWEIETIETRYKDHGVVSVYGGNSGAKNLKSIDEFLENDKIRIIVLHPRSAAHGLTLTNARYLIFYSGSYSHEEDYQAVKRVERAVQKRAMFIYYLLAEDSIDEIMFEDVQVKSKIQAQSLDNEAVGGDVDEIWKKLKIAIQQKKKRRKTREKEQRHAQISA